MVPGGAGGERQLLRTGFRQGAGHYSQERLVSGRLARVRQLLHPLRVRGREHPSINGTFKRLAATNKSLAHNNKSQTAGEATKKQMRRNSTSEQPH